MTKRQPPLAAELLRDLRDLLADLWQLLLLKRQLAEQEIRHDMGALRRLLIVGGLAVLSGLVGLPVLVTALALALDGWLGLGAAQWALLFSIPLVASGAVIAWISWRRFRREFLGLRESVHELHEDLQWIRDWLQ